MRFGSSRPTQTARNRLGLEHTLYWNQKNWWGVTAFLSLDILGTLVGSLVLVNRGLEAYSDG